MVQHRKEDGDESGMKNRKYQNEETNVTFNLWAVLIFIMASLISYATWSGKYLVSLDNRQVRTETNLDYVKGKVDNIERMMIQHLDDKGRR